MQDSESAGEQSSNASATFEVEHVGGIESTTAELAPGVTVLAGKNATNRTSFLQAIMAACGSDRASLKADADEGRVTMTIGGRTYERRLRRRNGTVTFGGDPYLDDPTLADLFAFLLEGNEARRAVERSEDLRELIMRPVDTAEIEREIRSLETERDEIDGELEELDALADELPELEAERRRLDAEIETTRGRLETAETELEDREADVDETRAENDAYEETIAELDGVQNERRKLERRIESERRSVESLEDEREKWVDELDALDDVPEDRTARIERKLERLRGQVQEVDATVGELQSVIQFNREFLEGDHAELVSTPSTESDGDVTDELVDDGTVVCWTCGSDVEREQIESTLERLESICNEKIEDRRSLEERIDDLSDEKSRLDERREEYEQAERTLEDVEAEIEERTDRLAEFTDRKERLDAAAERLEAEVERLEAKDRSEILELHQTVNRLQFELDQLESERADTESRIEAIESELERRDVLEREREDVAEELASLRTRVDDLQAQAVEAFNTHMDALLEQLGYERIERIWIERLRTETSSEFTLHIVRATDTGTVYEDTVDHLSESEREVTGLVFALAGYLVHDVYEQVPFMLLDSIEAIDADRIARLTDYLADYAEFLVVALLERDAQALDDSYPRIDSI